LLQKYIQRIAKVEIRPEEEKNTISIKAGYDWNGSDGQEILVEEHQHCKSSNHKIVIPTPLQE